MLNQFGRYDRLKRLDRTEAVRHVTIIGIGYDEDTGNFFLFDSSRNEYPISHTKAGSILGQADYDRIMREYYKQGFFFALKGYSPSISRCVQQRVRGIILKSVY